MVGVQLMIEAASSAPAKRGATAAAKAKTEAKQVTVNGELVIENATICDNEAYVKHCA